MQEYDKNNIFAQILNGTIPSVKIYENDVCLAIMDAFPQARGHALVIPKAPSRNLLDASPDTLSRILPEVQKLAVALKAALEADGIRIAQFNEAPAGQSVFHLHFHVIPAFEGERMKEHAPQTDDKGMASADDLEKIARQIRARLD